MTALERAQWVDQCIRTSIKAAESRSWWAEVNTREEFNAAIIANQRRMALSKYGRSGNAIGTREVDSE